MVASAGLIVGKEDEFEAVYTERFRTLLSGEGIFVKYERDRAAIDLGIHLTEPHGVHRTVSPRARIWFQLKGVHTTTLSLTDFEGSTEVPVSVLLAHLKFWFASPEPVYLALYIESADTFLVEDVRDLVYRQWGGDFLAPGKVPGQQAEATVRLRSDARLTRQRLREMRHHQAMRIDGPFFRGRPLGHHLDPLRCGLERLAPQTFVSMIGRLLQEHDLRIVKSLDPGVLFSESVAGDSASLTVGQLYHTYEWVQQLTTVFGYGRGDDFREEGAPQHSHGPVAVFIHGDPHHYPDAAALKTFGARLAATSVHQLLVFANCDENAYFGSFSAGIRGSGLTCVPQLLRDIAFNVLTTTIVYLEFRESISWKYVNYL